MQLGCHKLAIKIYDANVENDKGKTLKLQQITINVVPNGYSAPDAPVLQLRDEGLPANIDMLLEYESTRTFVPSIYNNLSFCGGSFVQSIVADSSSVKLSEHDHLHQ